MTNFFLEKNIFSRITEIRIENPSLILEAAQKREKRKKLTLDGKLTVLATDHPARAVNKVGEDPIRMADRHEFLSRIWRVLELDSWDGVMGTTDVIEDLLLLNYFEKKEKGKGRLDGKVILGCMNRGGLKGAIFELDDRFTSFDVRSIKNLGLDGAKLMFRLNFGQRDSGLTIDYCVKAISELNQFNIPVFLEALAVDEGLKTIKKAEDLVKIVGVATALGNSSRNIWLKIPYCENFEKVAKATTCPILMLGGEAKEDLTPLLQEFFQGMQAGESVRGVLVGRNILYPAGHDPLKVAGAVNGIVREGFSVPKALEYLKS